METMTVTRALAELKLLDKRIQKSINESRFVDLYQNRKDLALATSTTKAEFSAKAKASLQSITDLIDRRKLIKSAILLSNASVKISIGDKEYFVIEAIVRKDSIVYEQEFLKSMKEQLADVKHQMEDQKPKLESAVKDLLEKNLGGEKVADKEAYETIAKPFLFSNELNMLNPCDLVEVIEKLGYDLDVFLTEVDFSLSESNAKTEIEI